MDVMTDCLTPLNLLINAFHSNPLCVDIYQAPVDVDPTGFFQYLGVFGVTYILELPIYFLFLYRHSQMQRIFLINLIVNLATHPIIFLLMPMIFKKWDLNYLQYLLIAETFAPTVEAILLKKLFYTSWRTAIYSAILANLFSWTVGVYWT